MREIRKPPIGARPGTLAVPSGSRPVVKVLSYDQETIEEHAPAGLDEIESLTGTGRKLWIDVQGLTDEELLRGLARIFHIHPLALEDVVHVPNRPKAEAYEENLLVVTQMMSLADDRRVDVEQASLVIGRDFLLTFQERPGDVLEPVRARLQVPGRLIRTQGSDYLGYAILDTIIDAYYPVLVAMGERIEELEERVLDEASPETLRELNSVQGQLLVLRRVIAPQREALSMLLRNDDEFVSETVRTHLRDTQDHVVQTSEAVDGAREMVNGLINTHLSVISNRMNEVMKTLTIVASIFVPLTFMAGIYGMNFDHMPELHARWAYPVLLVAMTLTACAMLLYFWRKGWIGRRR